MNPIIQPTLFVHDRGQMCNNILQFGHVYAWAREHEYRALSMRFSYKYQYFHICHAPWHTFIVYALAKLAAKTHLLPATDFDKEPAANEEGKSRLLQRHRFAWIDGWNVRFPYLFLKYLDEIRALFAFDTAVEQAAQLRMMPWLTRNKCIRLGVHIRRGDYASFLGGKYFYDDETMLRFIGQFQALHPEKQMVVYICGNDPHLQPTTYERAYPDIHFVFPQGNPGEDLCVLSHCDYLMGAPSTFSLVGAMYHDVPIWWIPSREATLTDDSFSHFQSLFQQIEAYHTL